MIHHDSNLRYDNYNTINKHNQRQTHYISLIWNYFGIYFGIYGITFWMHYTLFIIIYRRSKKKKNFPRVRCFEIIYVTMNFKMCCNFINILFNWQYFISVTITFIFNMIVTPKIIYSYWFIITFFSRLKKILNVSKYSILIALVSFFVLTHLLYLYLLCNLVFS